MLRGLEVRDILIIDHLEIAFQPGLNVLTGETGAGKSILLDALGFVLGWRGRAELVRQGADQGEVTAWFDLPKAHPALAVLAEAGISYDDELILRRVNTKEGRKTAWVNDRRVSGDVLRALSDTLLELHGQHDDRGLLNPREHRYMLDSYGGLGPKVDALRAHWRALSAARGALEKAESALQDAKQEEDYLRHAVAELQALAPEPGEEATLDTQRRLMQAAARIREDIAKAGEALGMNGAEGMISDATRWLHGVTEQAEGRLDETLTALDDAMQRLDVAQRGIVDVLDDLSFNAADLEAVEERLFAIRGLARKHDVLPDDLDSLSKDLAARLALVDQSEAEIGQLQANFAAAQNKYDEEARKLRVAREKSAAKLAQAMGKELAPLKMERAIFDTSISAAEPGPEGADTVAFTVATNPGAPAGPLNKIASGGELSRFLLALKVCLSRAGEGKTMIFDEIDRGVGGATADAVGRRLADLSTDSQVLVVTHSPQVAALGGHHWRVEKHQERDKTLSTVIALDDAARIDEIARMLSGDTVTDAARAAAIALIET